MARNHDAATGSNLMVLTFLKRFIRLIGGALAAPRRTFGELLAGAPGGLSQALWLLGLQLLALQLPELVRAAWFLVAVDPRGGATMLVQVISQPLLLPLLAALAGSVLLGWFGKRSGGDGRTLDLAALALAPYLTLQLVGALAWRLLAAVGLNPIQVQAAVLVLGGGWFLVLLGLILKMMRQGTVGEGDGEGEGVGGGSASRLQTLAGGATAALVLLILTLNLVLILLNPAPLRPVGRGSDAPAFSLPDPGGATVKLADHQGEVVLISFWASWCGPCMREMPLLSKLQKELGSRGFQVLAVNVEGSRAHVQSVLARHREQPGLRDLKVLVDNGAVSGRYGVRTLPHLVLLDRAGRVAHVQVSVGGETKIRRQIKALLDKNPPRGS